jgi:hypothetical protein
VPGAGLVPVMALAERTGLGKLVAEHARQRAAFGHTKIQGKHVARPA